MSRKVAMNQIRFVCRDSDRNGIHVKSTLDPTYKLDGKTDESISFTDDDLIAIKNCLERPTEILFEAIRLPDGRQAVLTPSRQGTIKLMDRSVSQVRSECSVVLGAGETCMLRSNMWIAQTTGGAVFPV